MNRKLHLAWLLLGCIASTQVSAQSAAPSPMASSSSRAAVKADTKAALASGTVVKSSEGGSLENAPPAKPRKPKKPKASAMAASS